MPEPTRLEKAELRELRSDLQDEEPNGKRAKVQFNPETLKVSYSNQLVTPQGAAGSGGGNDRSGTPARQFVGAGTTKLALQLWFDVTAPLPEGEQAVDDVRKLTEKVAYFITPKVEGEHHIPPAVRFVWGSFQFDGLVDSLEESLEFFSSEGKPLRASVGLALSQQKIAAFVFRATRGAGGIGPSAAGPAPGTRPLTAAPAGASLPGLADQKGLGGQWQAIAARNGIETPRLLAPGQLIDMDLGTGLRPR